MAYLEVLTGNYVEQGGQSPPRRIISASKVNFVPSAGLTPPRHVFTFCPLFPTKALSNVFVILFKGIAIFIAKFRKKYNNNI